MLSEQELQSKEKELSKLRKEILKGRTELNQKYIGKYYSDKSSAYFFVYDCKGYSLICKAFYWSDGILTFEKAMPITPNDLYKEISKEEFIAELNNQLEKIDVDFK